jgi:hypothetical protein
MGILRSIFGPSKDEIWSQIAADIGGEYVDAGFWGKDVLVYKHGEWQILLDTYTVTTSSGKTTSSTTYTRMRAPFVNKDGLYFKIYREGLFSSIGKFFGMDDIEIGDVFFDDQFIIKGNNPEKIRLLLADGRIKDLIKQQPRIHFEIRDDEGWFGAAFPEGTDELYFRSVGVIKEAALLRSLFELFSLTLVRLVQIDSAYENDPKVTLQ